MPLIGKIFTNCGDKNYFSVIDLAEAFHQLPVHAELQPVLSFTWKGTNTAMPDVLLVLKQYKHYSATHGFDLGTFQQFLWMLYSS